MCAYLIQWGSGPCSALPPSASNPLYLTNWAVVLIWASIKLSANFSWGMVYVCGVGVVGEGRTALCSFKLYTSQTHSQILLEIRG